MSWAIGYDEKWKRWVGYGVPAYCDHPDCNEEIDRGLACVCGGEMFGGDRGCGLYFCEEHLQFAERLEGQYCERCYPKIKKPFKPKLDHPDWINHILTDESWDKWRKENPEKVKEYKNILENNK